MFRERKRHCVRNACQGHGARRRLRSHRQMGQLAISQTSTASLGGSNVSLISTYAAATLADVLNAAPCRGSSPQAHPVAAMTSQSLQTHMEGTALAPTHRRPLPTGPEAPARRSRAGIAACGAPRTAASG